jgi:histidine kinase/DNA gyrase B/HSP90-like ATPase
MRKFGGLGLGLAICKVVAEMHHGSIRAESDGPDQGSTFTVELPTGMAADAVLSPALSPLPQSQPSQARLPPRLCGLLPGPGSWFFGSFPRLWLSLGLLNASLKDRYQVDNIGWLLPGGSGRLLFAVFYLFFD